jgi:hypothetical protein
MNVRLRRCAAGIVSACAISLAAVPAGAAGDSVETPQGHAAEDAVELSPSAETRMSHETLQKTARAAAKADAAIEGDPAEVGKWGPVEEWPVVPIWAALLPDGKVLAYASVGNKATESFEEQNHTEATLWDPATASQTNVTLEDGFNIFCSGLAEMEEGNLFVAGGNKNQLLEGIVQTATFDWENDTWTQGLNMSYPRWYPSVTEMGNGEMLITSGGPPIPEVRQNDGTMRQLTHASLPVPLYPWMDVAPNGQAFESGPDQALRELNPKGTGSWQQLGERDPINRTYGSHAMYDIGKILVAGGGPSTKSADVININGATPTVTPTGEMAYGRRQNNATVLADGSVLDTGGNSSGAELVDMNAGVYPAELWNPDTGQWKTLASMRVTRQYHSTALLLPDGRVFSGGGGICGICDEVGYLNKNAEIFSPPYLFAKDGSGALAPRPTVSAAPRIVTEGTQFTVSTPDAASIRKVALVKLGTVTHSDNMGQRYVPVQFSAGNGSLSVTAPTDTSIAPPGYYMLFIINSAGVPSVAPILRVVAPEPPSTELPAPSAGGWTFNGSAALSGGEAVLTGATNFQRGDAIWPTTTDPQNMTIEFDASIGGGTGGDGLTLFFADPSRGATPTSLGVEGGGLGFSGIPGIAIALDEHQGPGAPSGNFVGISDGPTAKAEDVLHWLATANLTTPLQNATAHVKIVNSYGVTTIYINGTEVLSQALTLPASAYIGFSAGTGALNNRHAISDLVVSGATPPPSTLTADIAVKVPPGESEQLLTTFVVSGTCPSSFGTAALGNNESALATLKGAVAGASCSVAESAPTALGWSATASVNGGSPIALTASEGKYEVPSFALSPGINTVQFTNIYITPPAASLNVGVAVHAPSGSEQLAQTFTVNGSCPSSFATGPLGGGANTSPTLTKAIEGSNCSVTESAPTGSGWTATASVNGGVPVSLSSSSGRWTVPDFALAEGTNALVLTDTYTPSTSVPDPLAGGWALNGSSALSTTGLVLTPAANFLSGSAFWPKPVDPQNMTVEYDATVGGGTGADGLAMVIADPSRGATPTSLGSEGGGLGFSGIPGIGIALGEHQESGAPSNNFLGLSDGPTSPSTPNVLEWLATANVASPIQGATNRVKVVTANGNITISVNGTQLVNQALTLPASTYLGFSAGTGGLDNRHEVSKVLVNLVPPPSATLKVGVTVKAPAKSEQSLAKVVVSGTCPSSFTTTALGNKGTATPKLTEAVAGTTCLVGETAPPGVGWSPTASVNGGSPITLTASEGKYEVPSFALSAGANTVQFTNTFAPPTIKKVAPATGSAGGGTAVTLTGTGFTGATAVMFGSTGSSSFVVNSATSITARSPEQAPGVVALQVTTPAGTSAPSKGHYTVTPTVTAVSPSGGTNAGGAAVTITGSGFAVGANTTVVMFGPTPASEVTCSTVTTCTLVTPAHANGKVDVKATVNGVTSPKNKPADQYTFAASGAKSLSACSVYAEGTRWLGSVVESPPC